MKQVGDYVTQHVYDLSQNLLEWPYVFCHNIDEYFIFHKDTGEVVWVGETGLLGVQGHNVARITADTFNCLYMEEENDGERR